MIEISLPPIAPVLGEQPAIIEPALRDLPAFSGMEVSNPVRFEVEDVDDGEWLVLERQAVEVAFADDRVRRALADRHHTVIGTSRMTGKDGQDWALTLVAFCYDDGLTYEVAMRAESGRLAVVDVTTTSNQPAPTAEETDAAVRIAKSHHLVVDRLRPGYEAHALLVSAVEPGDEHYGRRRFSVVIGPEDERLPRIHAVVDLGSEKLVWVHGREVEES